MKYEYKLVENGTKGFITTKIDANKIINEYNKYGKDGWELVSMMDLNDSGSSNKIISIFKREIN